jgi:type IV fimbrial biogenesis protein FimT
MRRPLQPVGFTLLELMITLAVAAVLGAIATPSFTGMVQHQRLQAAARHLQADIALARHESTRRGQTVTLQFQPGSLWCYGVGVGPALDCQRPDTPAGSQWIKRVQFADYPGITLLQAGTMVLDPQTGTRLASMAHGQARFAATDGQQLQVRLGPQGRASVCAPAAPVTGTPPCPADPPGP